MLDKGRMGGLAKRRLTELLRTYWTKVPLYKACWLDHCTLDRILIAPHHSRRFTHNQPTSLQRNDRSAARRSLTITDKARSHCCVYIADFHHLVLSTLSAAFSYTKRTQFSKNNQATNQTNKEQQQRQRQRRRRRRQLNTQILS